MLTHLLDDRMDGFLNFVQSKIAVHIAGDFIRMAIVVIRWGGRGRCGVNGIFNRITYRTFANGYFPGIYT